MRRTVGAACLTAGVSTTPPPPSEQPSEQPSDQPSELAPQRRPDPRRNLAGVGFVLLGGYFAQSVWSLESSLWLKVVLAVVGVAVAVYGVVQLVQNRRR